MCMLSIVSAIYTRSELQNMKALEIEKQTKILIDSTLADIERNIIEYAKAGKTQYTFPFPGCETAIRGYEYLGAVPAPSSTSSTFRSFPHRIPLPSSTSSTFRSFPRRLPLPSAATTMELCEYVVNEVKTRFANDFPDTDVLYDDKSQYKMYIIKWD